MIPQTMQAVVKYANGDGKTELRQVPVPEIGPQDVLVKVEAVGICGSDPHIHHEMFAFPIPTPLILGHEFTGVIVKAGSEVSGFQVGDRVTSETHASYCGKCRECRTGNYQVCRERKGFGFHVDGAFAAYVKVPEISLHRLPEATSFETGSLTEPVCVAYNAVVKKTGIEPGDAVAVFGPGPIGLLCLEMARLCGANPLIIIGIGADQHRMDLAKKMGATHCVNSDAEDTVERIKEITNGQGVEAVIDTAGVGPTLKYAMEAVCPSGRITKVGWGPKPLGYTIDPIIQKTITLQGSFSHNWPIWERCLKLMESGQIQPERIITDILPLKDWHKGFELMEARKSLKIILKP
ncbi:alcohol dehydrogenase/L-iditol 2-dehydrogenase [Hydrogenispora ethanolica]|uniref:Alcohol dehydrogenase/L-iditol 2-dehydrogenase n=1 Tax=Hydrogenispora ethanolica TaxID=1082276 RepID=A0A4R1R829_HYDET|nr:zinc-binding dehydrogenase [Hydrogenispora ethanolica]TCL61786.1 alcohol dehydrogenase/L-iditol 2-dehydrogenase [Hydrogenispora ethanolica]